MDEQKELNDLYENISKKYDFYNFKDRYIRYKRMKDILTNMERNFNLLNESSKLNWKVSSMNYETCLFLFIIYL